MRTSRYGTRSFRSTAAKMWNSLPKQFRDITNHNVFKSQINVWSGGLVHDLFVQILKPVCFMLKFNSSYAVVCCL